MNVSPSTRQALCILFDQSASRPRLHAEPPSLQKCCNLLLQVVPLHLSNPWAWTGEKDVLQGRDDLGNTPWNAPELGPRMQGRVHL